MYFSQTILTYAQSVSIHTAVWHSQQVFYSGFSGQQILPSIPWILSNRLNPRRRMEKFLRSESLEIRGSKADGSFPQENTSSFGTKSMKSSVRTPNSIKSLPEFF